MIPELGHFSLIVALCLSLFLSFFSLVGAQRGSALWIALSRPMAILLFLTVGLSFVCLAYAFITNDFSVLYVSQHSNSQLPVQYKFSAVWGGHEGSLLLWVLLLTLWTAAVAVFSQRLPDPVVSRVLGVLALVILGFLLFILLTSNPFDRLIPAATEGRDLNPLLQDPGLVYHPPMLYMGYVGFSVAFAFAIAALISGKLDAAWARWSRPWTLAAWIFLTLGICFGSHWAYYELGWGGWWFWDPVENISFIPWVLAIALIHLLMTTDKRQSLQALSLLLALLVFSFSLIGAFLVRSGILTSVHTFAADPKRGLFLLIFLFAVVCSAFLLYALRVKKLIKVSVVEAWSRELMILISVLFLMVGAFTVLLGTLFPLLYELLTHKKISVGFPYFNAVFIPLSLPVLLLVPVGPLVKWGRNTVKEMIKKMGLLAFLSLLCGVLFGQGFSKLSMGLAIGLWIILVTLKTGYQKVKAKGGFFALSGGAIGMLFAHAGIGILVLGIVLVSHFEIEKDVVISVGQKVTVREDTLVFESLEKTEGPNYLAYQGHFGVYRAGHKINDLYPEKRLFVMPGTRFSETAILPGFLKDIYIALGEPLKNGQWTVRVYVKPCVRWIWLGALMIGFGALVAAFGRRIK